MNRVLLPLILLIAFTGLGLQGQEGTYFVIGYVFCEENLLDPGTIDAEKLTHINYAFADIRGGKMVEGFSRDQENLAALRGLKKNNPALKVLISVGGWTWSGAFSDMCLTRESRKLFIDSAAEFLIRHDLDGLDIDWEYPGLPGYGNTHRPEDKENFTSLLRECRQRLDAEGKKRGKHYLLTAAVGAFPDFLGHTEMAKAASYMDLVNLMTYDFAEAEADPLSTHHANLYPNPAAPKNLSAAGMVDAFIKEGVPAEKLVLGVPFYGRAWGEVNAGNNGLFQPGKPVRINTGFRSISAKHLKDPEFKRFWDEKAQAPFLWNATKKIFISYEDPQSLALKCKFVREKGIRGVMFWAYGSDGGELLDVIHANLGSKVSGD